MTKLVILQTVVPDYRHKLFFYLKETFKANFEIYGGKHYFEKTVITDNSIEFLIPVHNIYFRKRSFLFQYGMWPSVFRKNVMVLELNPRILSNWMILLIRKILFKKTVLWGHAWPRKGFDSNTDFIRGFMRNLASDIIVYTETQKKELQEKMPQKKIVCAPNSLFYKNEMITHINERIIKNVIYVGRLTKLKKPLLLVKAFEKAMKNIPKNSNLLIVGDGLEKETIQNYIDQKNDLKKQVSILGHIGEYMKLKELYNTSLVSISPGYVGLSITQSLSFGVPMIVSKDENHSPEIEAVIEGVNAQFFKTNDIDSLSQKICEFYDKKDFWVKQREEVSNFCKKKYSIEVMAKSFIELIQ